MCENQDINNLKTIMLLSFLVNFTRTRLQEETSAEELLGQVCRAFS